LKDTLVSSALCKIAYCYAVPAGVTLGGLFIDPILGSLMSRFYFLKELSYVYW